VSTIDQSLDLQLDALNEFGCDEIFKEKVSGAKDDREELMQALRMLRAEDKFVVYKLDRLARSTKRLIEIADELREKEVEFVSIQNKLDTGTATGKAMFGMLSVLQNVLVPFKRMFLCGRLIEKTFICQIIGFWSKTYPF
jgi:DNA invertase Pin-like site-specific DNA recombinase